VGRVLVADCSEGETEPARYAFRVALVAELDRLIRNAAAAGLLPAGGTAELAAPALVGALIQGAIGPLAPEIEANAPRQREAVQALTLLVLRALGVPDARARGLVAQCALPPLRQGAA
jgi:hypothetical protein